MNARQQGFSIVEVVVAMVMMTVILTMLGGLTFKSAQQALWASDATTREAVTLSALNRFATLPYDQLGGAAGCTTLGTTNKQYERCVTVSGTGNTRSVQIVTTPLQRTLIADTVRLTRAGPPPPNPLCLSC